MVLVAWTAAFAVYMIGATIVVLIALRLAINLLPPGRLRTTCDVLFALLGLAVATVVVWF